MICKDRLERTGWSKLKVSQRGKRDDGESDDVAMHTTYSRQVGIGNRG